jgi:hypothetical protein
MSIRQVELAESDDRILEAESQRTGLSVSELVHRAIERCYGATSPRRSTKAVFPSVRANSATRDEWDFDPLFDDDSVLDDDQVPVERKT